MKLSIIVPCYNEEKNIPLILERFEKVVNGKDIEVILVDNNSKDQSAVVLKDLLPKYPFARSFFEPVAGYGSAILAGLRNSTGEFVGWTHGDLQTPASDVVRGLEILKAELNSKNCMVKGSRLGRPIIDRLFTFGMGIFESIYLKKALTDINAQPNIFHRSFFEKWQNPPIDFSLDLYALYLAKKMKLKVIRFPVQFSKRLHGESSWNRGWVSRWKFIKRTIEFSFKLKKNFESF